MSGSQGTIAISGISFIVCQRTRLSELLYWPHNHADLIHITPADMPNPYNSLLSESYVQRLINAVPCGGPIIEEVLTFSKDGRTAGVLSSSVTGPYYTSVSME